MSDAHAGPRYRWRVILPIAQVIAAIGLILLAQAEEQAYLDGIRAESYTAEGVVHLAFPAWGHVPIAEQLVIMINFPAALIAIPTSFLSGNYAWISRTAFILSVAVFWYWLGRGLDRRRKLVEPARTRFPRWLGTGLYLGGLLASSAAAFSSAHSFFYIGHTPLAYIAGFIWSVGFIAYFVSRLARRLGGKHTQGPS